MKIAYIDIVLDGHHLNYLKTLIKDNPDSILIVPEKIDDLENKQYVINSYMLYKHPINYIKWIFKIRKILKEESIDIAHFLYGDVFYRYFGIGLNRIKNTKVLVTFHQVRRSIIKDISLKSIFKKIDLGVVHTDSLKKDLNCININNVKKIEYPQFHNYLEINPIDAKNKLNLPKDVPIISAIGGTREDKGLDLLLKALNNVDHNFHLLIAGSEVTFNKEYIYKSIEKYKNRVTTILKYLSEDELNSCLVATDIIVLPYRKSFDGASGPLGEGVWLRKMIIGPNHGSIGRLIEDNNLGITFETENIEDLAKTISEGINKKYIWNKEAELYREKLDCEKFKNEYKLIYKKL